MPATEPTTGATGWNTWGHSVTTILNTLEGCTPAAVFAVGNSGATKTLSVANGPAQTMTLTGNCTITLTGATSGQASTLELVLTQDGTGSRTVTWPGSVVWPSGVPTLSTAAAAVDRVRLVTYNGGTTWYGILLGAGTRVTVDGTAVAALALDSTPAVFNDLSDAATLRTQLFGGSARTQKPFFAAKLSANLSLTNNTTTLIPNSSLTIAKDTDSGWSTGSSNYAVPVNGFYRVHFLAVYANNATGDRYTNVTLNSTSSTAGSIGEIGTGGSATYDAYHHVLVDDRLLSAGDILRFYVYQNSGGALNLLQAVSGGVATAVTVEWIRPS